MSYAGKGHELVRKLLKKQILPGIVLMYKPDEFDWKIITLLNEDGRMPSAEIARKLGNVSARTVTNRINALTENGIISVRAIVDPVKVGYVAELRIGSGLPQVIPISPLALNSSPHQT